MKHIEKAVKKAFDKYDADGSGALDRDELGKLLKDMCFFMDLEELGQTKMNNILKFIDESGDGEIDYPELLVHIEKVVETLMVEENTGPEKGENRDTKVNSEANPRLIKGLGRQLKLLSKLNRRKDEKDPESLSVQVDLQTPLDSPSPAYSKGGKSCFKVIKKNSFLPMDNFINPMREMDLFKCNQSEKNMESSMNFDYEIKNRKDSADDAQNNLRSMQSLTDLTSYGSSPRRKNEYSGNGTFKKYSVAIAEEIEPFSQKRIMDEGNFDDLRTAKSGYIGFNTVQTPQNEMYAQLNNKKISQFGKNSNIIKSAIFNSENPILDHKDTTKNEHFQADLDSFKDNIYHYLETLNKTSSVNDMKLGIKKYIKSLSNDTVLDYYDSLCYKNLVNMMKVVQIEREKVTKIVDFLNGYLVNAE